MTNEITVNVLTLNCWGIPYVSKNRKVRMEAIAEKFVIENYDIICLQEVWSVDDFKMIKAKTQEQLPYSHYFYSGVFGSGICILSRYPIQDVMFHKWTLNGYVHKIHHGDWFGGKGIALCKLKIYDMNVNVYIAHLRVVSGFYAFMVKKVKPNMQKIDKTVNMCQNIQNMKSIIQLHAEYDRHNDEYLSHRILQAFDTAQFIRMTSGGVDSAILGGDLNAEPQDISYRIMCGVAGLADSCSNSSSDLGTSECANNSYTGSKLARLFPEGKRIDHILYLGSNNYKVEVINFQHPFPKRVPYKDFSYSDHEAIMATLKFSPGATQSINVDMKESLKEALNICENSLKSVRKQRFWYLLSGCILIVPLIWSMGLDCSVTSVGVSIGLNVGRVFLTAILCYTLFMSTVWNSTERNALKAGCLGMEIYLTNLNNNVKK